MIFLATRIFSKYLLNTAICQALFYLLGKISMGKTDKSPRPPRAYILMAKQLQTQGQVIHSYTQGPKAQDPSRGPQKCFNCNFF